MQPASPMISRATPRIGALPDVHDRQEMLGNSARLTTTGTSRNDSRHTSNVDHVGAPGSPKRVSKSDERVQLAQMMKQEYLLKQEEEKINKIKEKQARVLAWQKKTERSGRQTKLLSMLSAVNSLRYAQTTTLARGEN